MFGRDLPQIRRIHEKFYEKEFSFDEFSTKFLSSFVVHDDENNIITAGGVRTVAEVVLVTDKDRSTRTRREALIHAYDASKYIAKESGHNSVHAFVQDENWVKQLLRYGFREVIGQAVIIDT